jgi:imidazolonepropionase-like amidohydrolase
MKKTAILLLMATTMLVGAGSASAGDITVIHAGTLLAVPGEAPKTEQSVIIENGRITDVKSGYVSVAGAKVVDLKSSFVMPGLMDMHIHLTSQLGDANSYQKTVQEGVSHEVMRGIQYGNRILQAGFTTVRNLGTAKEVIYGIRDGINRGWVDGPRIIASVGVGATGGHGDIDGMKPELLDLWTSNTTCDGPYDCRRAVRQAVKYGADLIKITSTGGVLSDTETGVGQQMEDDELIEVMKTAHSLGRKVAAHAHAAAGVNAALRAGVDTIEHGTYMNAESLKLFKETGAVWIPTLSAGDFVMRMARDKPNFFPENIRRKALRVGTDMQNTFARAYKGKINIAFGTDSGVAPHGTNAKEFSLMKLGGMTDHMELIKTATINAAKVINMEDSLGQVKAGFHADIIAVDGNPLNDIKELEDVDFVMKAGKVVKH